MNDWRQNLLDWTAKQGRILTDEGKAIRYYCSEQGFPFTSNELPHYHLERGDSHVVFHRWAEATAAASGDSHVVFHRWAEATAAASSDADQEKSSPIVGAWSRPLFTGRWEHSTDREEIVYNIQTGSLFIDLRIPTSKPVSRWEKILGDENNEQQVVISTSCSSRQFLESMND
ncbi:hypothetical protein ACHAXM_000461 [Skeletonema potamos]